MMEWLSGLLGESTANIVGFIIILAIILCGILAVLALIRRVKRGSFTAGGRNSPLPRLSVMDAAPVDSKRKLVLIRRDDVEHLLLIGGPTDVVVEQNITKEPRGDARQVESRIDPEQIERFRQSEATITANRDNTIQLNSPIEPPVAAIESLSSEPVKEEISTTPVQRNIPIAPVAPKPQEMNTQPGHSSPMPRPAPSYPPQPRHVMPAKTASQSKAPQLHPAYPLSRVSRGVLTSTSGAATGAQTASPPAPAVDLQKVSPAQEASSPKSPQTSSPEPSIDKLQSFQTVGTNEVSAIKQESRLSAVRSAEPSFADDSTQLTANDAGDEVIFDPADFESEMLGSLDISPVESKQEFSIEDEMEKLLGDLTTDHKHKA